MKRTLLVLLLLVCCLGAAPQMKWDAIDHIITTYATNQGPDKKDLDDMGQRGWTLQTCYTVEENGGLVRRFVWSRVRWPK